jgi:hypothetical protein
LLFEVSYDFCAFEVEGKPLALRGRFQTGSSRGGAGRRNLPCWSVWVWNLVPQPNGVTWFEGWMWEYHLLGCGAV